MITMLQKPMILAQDRRITLGVLVDLPHLDVTSPSIQVHVQVLDLSKLPKQLLQVLLASFLVDVGNQDDPALNGAYRDSPGRSARFGCRCG